MCHSFFTLSTIIMSDLLCSSIRSVGTENSYSIFEPSFSSTLFGVSSHHLLPVGNPYLLHIIQWITTSTLSCCHRQYCFCVSILHSATTWPIVYSLFLHNLQRSKTFCWSTFLFILFVLSGCFVHPLTFPQFPSSAFLISASFNFLGSSFHMTSP